MRLPLISSLLLLNNFPVVEKLKCLGNLRQIIRMQMSQSGNGTNQYSDSAQGLSQVLTSRAENGLLKRRKGNLTERNSLKDRLKIEVAISERNRKRRSRGRSWEVFKSEG